MDIKKYKVVSRKYKDVAWGYKIPRRSKLLTLCSRLLN